MMKFREPAANAGREQLRDKWGRGSLTENVFGETPGQRGRGRNVQSLNICACKKLSPVPSCPNALLFGRINEQLAKACMNTMCPFSETELRAAQPNLHSGRLRSLLQVAAR